MPRIRTIKPEFWSSPGVAHMNPWARLLFIALWNWADDFGRGTFNPRELMGFAFPNDEEMTVDVFRTHVDEIRTHVDVEFYRVHERDYFQIPSWKLHQRIDSRLKQSKFPGPEDGEPINPRSGTIIETVGEKHTHVDVKRTHVDVKPGKTVVGTGEQGNRGTGEEGNTPPSENTDPAHGANAPGEPNPLEQLAAAYAATHTPPSQGGTPDQWSTPEDPRCWKHRAIPRDRVPACRACGDARAWFKTQAADKHQARREAINKCTQCDDNGIHYANGVATRCTHQPTQPKPHMAGPF